MTKQKAKAGGNVIQVTGDRNVVIVNELREELNLILRELKEMRAELAKLKRA